MPIIKCKMCGGDIELSADKTFGTCDYCGSTMTLPKVDDDQRAAAFNRGNHFRRIGEFDKALAVYERIVAEDDTDAEAHWCCALCRFGIEYVEDPNTYEYLPTCHRASFDSFLEDVDYLAAVEHSDGITKRQYQKEAVKIAEVQKGILATSQNEEPFDVFICYKETDDNTKERTHDSIDAQEIYYQLTQAGYRVFFSRITLEDKAGAEYEPYIFAALNSAKVMVAVGSKPEYFNAIWVKNEWSRFLALMRKDRSKLLLPCYKDMDPYDLPEQLSVLQSYDMTKIGFMQDLIRGIKKVLDSDKKPEPVKETVVVQQTTSGNATLTAQIKRGQQALEDHDWTAADGYFDKALDIDAECAEAFFGKALAAAKCASGEELVQKRLAVPVTDTETLTACEKDTARINKAVKTYMIPGYYKESAVRQAFEKDERTYSSQTAAWQTRIADETAYWKNDRQLSRAVRYAKGEFANTLNGLQTKIQEALKKSLANSQTADKQTAEQVRTKYAKMMDDAESAVRENNNTAQTQRLKDYEEAVQLQETGKTEEDFRKAATLFEKTGDFENAPSLKEQCAQKADALKAEAEQLAKEEAEKKAAEEARQAAERKRKIKKIGIITVAILAVIAVAMVVVTQIVIPSSRYAQAEALLEAGDKAGAASAFGALDDYKDARSRAYSLWNELAERDTIAAGTFHTIGLKSDGTIVATGQNSDGQCDADGWTDIVAIAAGTFHTVGLKDDGTVVAVGSNDYGQCDADGWIDIVAIAAGGSRTVGLKGDGTVVAVGSNSYGQCDVTGWTDIVAIAAGGNHTVGLKSDGTVVATGRNDDGQCDVENWTDVVAVAAGGYHTIGLKSDGTVVATGRNSDGRCDVKNWTDVVAVAAGYDHTVGLKSDGTVVATGRNDDGQCDVENWTDVVAVPAGYVNTVGLKSDGTVVAVGKNEDGRCDVGSWTDIKIPNQE